MTGVGLKTSIVIPRYNGIGVNDIRVKAMFFGQRSVFAGI